MTEKPEKNSSKNRDEEAKPPIGKWIGIGIGAGIGSAAIAAALLYTSGAKRKPGGK